MMKMMNKYIAYSLGCMLLMACSAHDEVSQFAPEDVENIIHVSGVSTTAMVTHGVTTRAAETIEVPDWLKTGLTSGLDITYYKTAEKSQDVKLTFDGSAYHLKKSDTEAAKWLGNGAHTFEGVYVPEKLKQSSTADYEALEQYTAIPPSTKISATLEGITIPLQHRLARVEAFVLIDESLGNGVDIAKLQFCNVDVLDHVDADNQPVWTTAKRMTPHGLADESSVKVYQDQEKNLIFPIDKDYAAASTDQTGKYTLYKEYKNVHRYDIIVRPTYQAGTTKADEYVMYDEAKNDEKGQSIDYVALNNKIDFDLTLNNGLEYEKEFEFDLNANNETVVYLRVSPENIDYKSAGSRLWQSHGGDDDYYGVNHEGYALSHAGSSWQRAYTNDTLKFKNTDGHAYDDVDSESEKAQYVSTAQFINLLQQATANGACNHKYFILHNDIEIDLANFPDDIVFTGHLDALDRQIKVKPSDERNWLFAGIGEGWSSEVLNTKIVGGTLFKTDAAINGHVSNCWNDDIRIEDVTPPLQEYSKQ